MANRHPRRLPLSPAWCPEPDPPERRFLCGKPGPPAPNTTAVAVAQAERRGGTSQGSAGAEPSRRPLRPGPRTAAHRRCPGCWAEPPGRRCPGCWAEPSRPSPCPACLGRGGSLSLPVLPKCRVTLLANPTGPPLTEYKKKSHKQRELEKCATSTRSESTCGKRSFSSGKARLYARSAGTGCCPAGLLFPPHARGTAPRHSLSRKTASARLSWGAFSPLFCSSRLAIAQPRARDFPRLWELLRLISTAISVTAVLKTPTPAGCKVTTSGG